MSIVRLVTLFTTLALILMLGACAKPYTKKSEAPPLAVAAPANYAPPCADHSMSAFECDRRSILAMAGEYRVKFAFDETAALAPGYTPHAPQHSGGTELVLAIEDTGTHIVLQHILVLGDKHTVVKHWRQDWQFEPTSLERFRGLGRFAREAVTQEVAKGAWSQTVYDVDDAPRYAGVAHWTHRAGVDAWESDRTWRPLPRRDYSTRSDYQALEVVNRHTLTPAGWVHEQDNTKLILRPDGTTQAIARERGVDSYTHTSDYDFTAGREYWNRTQSFWALVRQHWASLMNDKARLTVLPEPNGEPRIDALFKLADAVVAGNAPDANAITAIVDQYVR